MLRCDCCGRRIYPADFERGAIKAIPDQPETDNLCINCNCDVDVLGVNLNCKNKLID